MPKAYLGMPALQVTGDDQAVHTTPIRHAYFACHACGRSFNEFVADARSCEAFDALRQYSRVRPPVQRKCALSLG